MANKVYPLSYDDVLDKDIKLWLDSLPRNRKAEMVRTAIRQYMLTSGTAPVIIPIAEKNEEPKKIRPKLNRGGDFES